ncbi:MAG: NADH-quinone oxidoreductase subunit J [Nocardioides sp.]|uniref:NADH-quinone oxidoreductase subunit J n=1 Tax=Nocardioides sp. TaxID=35761 RepID=UPI003D6A1D58
MSFVILASITVIGALGLLFARKPVHAALSLAVVMVGLAMIYATLEAPFLFAVQIVVYTGAILMLFLFVIMLVGVDTSDTLKETISGQKVLASVLGVGLGATLIAGVGQASIATMRGLSSANEGGNVQRLADLLFSRYVVAFEATSALLITAAIGAMVLAHRERIDPKPTQTDLAQQRVHDYAKSGKHLGPLPPPGTFARHNSNDTPALLPDGSHSEKSVPAILAGGASTNGEGDDE